MKKDYKVLVLIIVSLLGLIVCSVVITTFILLHQRSTYVNHITRPNTSFPLNLKWEIDLGQSTYERPAYNEGLILLPANTIDDSYWYGIDVVTGEIVWSQQIDQFNYRRCLTSEYLVLSGPWSLIVLQIQTGNIVWQENRPPAFTATCSQDAVFSSTVPRDSIWAYELATGKRIWTGTKPWKGFSEVIYNPKIRELIAKETNLPENT